MKFRDGIVQLCKIMQWLLPCLLLIAIVVMIAMEPSNVEPVDAAGDTSGAVLQTAEATADEEATENTDAEERNGNADTTDSTQESSDMDSIFAENVQLGVVENENDGGLDGSASGSTAPVQSGGDTNSAADSDTAQILDSRLDPLHPDFDIMLVSYEDFQAMDADRQRAIVEYFSSMEMFVRWYNAVKEKYEAEHPNIELGEDGIINGENFG